MKKFIYFGFITSSFIFAFAVKLVSFLIGSDYINNFIQNKSLEISSTMLGFNIAILTILISQINYLEDKVKKKSIFKKTKSELKDNALFNIKLVIANFFLNVVNSPGSTLVNNYFSEHSLFLFNYFIETSILACVVMNLVLIKETTTAVFSILEQD